MRAHVAAVLVVTACAEPEPRDCAANGADDCFVEPVEEVGGRIGCAGPGLTSGLQGIEGTVTADGVPIAGASVASYDLTATSALDGTYRLDIGGYELVHVDVTAADLAPLHVGRWIERSADPALLDLPMVHADHVAALAGATGYDGVPRGVATVRVLDCDRAPVRGVAIAVSAAAERRRFWARTRVMYGDDGTHTGDDGTAIVAGIPTDEDVYLQAWGIVDGELRRVALDQIRIEAPTAIDLDLLARWR